MVLLSRSWTACYPSKFVLLPPLGLLIRFSEEFVIVSETASRNSHFLQLGLTDAVLLEAITSEAPPVTVDLDLYLAALRKVGDAAVNFTHLRTHLEN